MTSTRNDVEAPRYIYPQMWTPKNTDNQNCGHLKVWALNVDTQNLGTQYYQQPLRGHYQATIKFKLIIANVSRKWAPLQRKQT